MDFGYTVAPEKRYRLLMRISFIKDKFQMDDW